jgi:hypothetical protein
LGSPCFHVSVKGAIRSFWLNQAGVSANIDACKALCNRLNSAYRRIGHSPTRGAQAQTRVRMDSGITFTELLQYTERETKRWKDWFAAHSGVLNQPRDIARAGTIRSLLLHIFATESKPVPY